MRRERTGGHGAVPAVAVPALLLAGLLALLLVWFAHTPGTLYGAGDVLTAVGRLAGLAAGYAAGVLVALMARVPLLERAVGTDRLVRWHARAGRYTVALVVLHGVTVVTGYALAAHVSVGRETARLLTGYPYLSWALAAGLLLLAVGATSARAALRRIGYEPWYLTHLLTYLAVGLAFAHQLADGADLLYDPPARLAWTAGYAALAALVAWYRLARPLLQAARQRTRVQAVVAEAPGVVSLLLRGDGLAALGARPGQFVRLRPLTRDGWWQAHPFSLSAPVCPPLLRVTVKAVGDHTRTLHRLRPGTRVVVEGPFGAFTATGGRPDVLLVAGGIGIAPLRALFETMPAGRLTLLYRCRSSTEAVFRAELDRIAAERDAEVVYLEGGFAFTGEALAALVSDLTRREVYLCGPPAMRAAATAALRAAGVPRRRIRQESFELPRSGRRPVAAPAGALAATVAGVALLVGPRLAWQQPVARTGVPPAGPRLAGGGAGPPPPRHGAAAGRVVRILGTPQRTLFSTVQVEITVAGGQLRGVTAVSLPNLDAHSRELSAMAAPILRREALASGGADIHVVSGATYTSTAYAASLQGALDQLRARGR